ncbi:MAG TPA: gliding motility-associated C-terminal domain-containing protein [Salinimicrobium sp.]|nr:gliding motility-associated C-terminal domain-containing protein [Salinimicrobium sp.]
MKKPLLFLLFAFSTGVLSSQNLVDFTVDAGEDVQLDCLSGPCVEIDADFTQTYNPLPTHAYNVVSLPFDPVPTSNPTGLSNDDTYSAAIALPFGFTFYGETYNQVIIGGNGDIVFNTAYANAYNSWPIDGDQLVPDPTLGGNANGPTAAIFGAFHDLNINDMNNSLVGTIEYEVTGEAPFRAFVVNYTDVAQFGSSCDAFNTTQQIVLHETSNYIDVYITEKPLCTGWNDGYAVIGIQNPGGTLGVSPPGRNTGLWEADMEAWRFKPVPDPDAANFVYNLLDADGNVVSLDNPSDVCLVNGETQTFTAQVIYTDGDGETFPVEDEVTVSYGSEDLSGNLADVQLCEGEPDVELNATPNNNSLDQNELSYSWTDEAGNVVGTAATYTATSGGIYTVDITYGNCTETFQSEVVIGETPIIDLGADFNSCFDEPVVLDATPSNFTAAESTFVWYMNNNVLPGEDEATLNITEVGTYSVSVTVNGCEGQDQIEVSQGNGIIVDLGGNISLCESENQVISINSSISVEDTGNVTYSWTLDGVQVGSEATLTGVNQSGIYTLSVSNGACTGTGTVEVIDFCIPEGISPGNSDGINDCMDLEYLSDRTGIKSIEIFNRYGTSVFTQNNYVKQWCGQTQDGEDLPTGTYYYVIKFNGQDEVYGAVKTGWVYLVREVN